MPAPVVTMNERDTVTDAVALMDPLALTDADRDRIAAAIAAGAGRASPRSAVRATPGRPWPTRCAWTAGVAGRPRGCSSTIAARCRSCSRSRNFSSGAAKRPAPSTPGAHRACQADGCLCLEMAPTFAWRIRAGRPQLGLLSTAVADLNLHIALTLQQLRLPAALGQDVLGAAAQDFVDEVRPTDPDDWLSLVRGARTASRERIEDYVAASAAVGPLVPAEP